jgi:hypothetical protein
MTLRTFVVTVVATLLAACGGSGSETPPPVEPTSPVQPDGKAERPTADSVETEGTTKAEPSPPPDPDAE